MLKTILRYTHSSKHVHQPNDISIITNSISTKKLNLSIAWIEIPFRLFPLLTTKNWEKHWRYELSFWFTHLVRKKFEWKSQIFSHVLPLIRNDPFWFFPLIRNKNPTVILSLSFEHKENWREKKNKGIRNTLNCSNTFRRWKMKRANTFKRWKMKRVVGSGKRKPRSMFCSKYNQQENKDTSDIS